MSCRRVQEAISARIDGEDPGMAPERIDAHLASCPVCRAFAASAAAVHRQVRVPPAQPIPDPAGPPPGGGGGRRAEPIPDLADAILRAATPPAAPAAPVAPEWPRYVLL